MKITFYNTCTYGVFLPFHLFRDIPHCFPIADGATPRLICYNYCLFLTNMQCQISIAVVSLIPKILTVLPLDNLSLACHSERSLNSVASAFPVACCGISQRMTNYTSLRIEDSPQLAAESFNVFPMGTQGCIRLFHRLCRF